jgi:hypothetical protein
MLVELDVFSGRPNPRWQLDEHSTRELRRLQSRLTVSTLAPPEPPGLGYRGFSYTDAMGSCRAYKGYVRTSRATLADPSFSIEGFLLDRLPVEFAPLRRRVASKLGQPD